MYLYVCCTVHASPCPPSSNKTASIIDEIRRRQAEGINTGAAVEEVELGHIGGHKLRAFLGGGGGHKVGYCVERPLT